MIRLGLFFFFFAFSQYALGSTLSSSRVEPSSLEELSESKLLTFFKNKEILKQGDELILFSQTTFLPTHNEFYLESTLDGVKVDMMQSSESLWLSKFSAFSEVKEHLYSVNIFAMNKKEKNRTENALKQLKKELRLLKKALLVETDPARIEALEKEKAQKEAYRDSLEEALENLKVFVKTESFSFSVEQNTENGNFPYLTAISPGVGLNIGGGVLTLSGFNFLPNSIVKIGGVNASVLSESASSIQVISPTFATLGVKEVEVSYPVEQKNTVLKNSFTVTDQGILKNLRPVANAQTYVTAIHPVTNPVALDASTSYDENNPNELDYVWTVITAPNNSGVVPGSTLPNQPNPSVMPGKKGTYVFELRVRESSTSEHLESLPINIILEVTK
ncbi:MAG: IPT/TIG domain-containing protein [Oligoflexia bacterium]|nr:IPT/TIG domain-containing protein [Oligoflexia bacterium]